MPPPCPWKPGEYSQYSENQVNILKWFLFFPKNYTPRSEHFEVMSEARCKSTWTLELSQQSVPVLSKRGNNAQEVCNDGSAAFLVKTTESLRLRFGSELTALLNVRERGWVRCGSGGRGTVGGALLRGFFAAGAPPLVASVALRRRD